MNICRQKVIALILLAMLQQIHGQNDTIGCFVAGECSEGLVSGIISVNTIGECVDFCQSTESCQYFSYSPSDDICLSLDKCPLVSTDYCEDCVSGDSTCPNELCNVEGMCHGYFESHSSVSSVEECAPLCASDTLCNWWTFDESSQLCLLFEECPELTNNCETCVSGQKDCVFAAQCRDGWTEFEGACYKYKDIEAVFEMAEADCVTEGGHLVSIHNERENSFVGALSFQIIIIMGLNDFEVEGEYVWTDGSPVDYTNWDGSQPTGTSIENVVRMNDYEDDLWSDYTDQTVHYVCKY